MRIISGKYRGFNLFSLNGNRTRPTMDATKEVIFSVLFDCIDLVFLDLFSGSGALGLEAVSRGAKKSVLVESGDKAFAIILKNINKLNCSSSVELHKKRVSSFLNQTLDIFDIIILDPPYEKQLINITIKKIIEKKILSENGKIVVEHSPYEVIDNIWKENIIFEKKIGRSQITILEKF